MTDTNTCACVTCRATRAAETKLAQLKITWIATKAAAVAAWKEAKTHG
jgi:hypothetical protein